MRATLDLAFVSSVPLAAGLVTLMAALEWWQTAREKEEDNVPY